MEVREAFIAYGKEKMPIDEYLEIENVADEKHEYYKGEIFAMSGAKVPHNTIAKFFLGILFNKLKEKKCKPFNSDQRIHITEIGC